MTFIVDGTLRPGLPQAGLKALSEYRLANKFRSFVMDEARIKELRERYLQFTAPPPNRGLQIVVTNAGAAEALLGAS